MAQTMRAAMGGVEVDRFGRIETMSVRKITVPELGPLVMW
jgi:hypothetical protein